MPKDIYKSADKPVRKTEGGKYGENDEHAPVEPGMRAIMRRRQLMEDESVLMGEPDAATKPWRKEK